MCILSINQFFWLNNVSWLEWIMILKCFDFIISVSPEIYARKLFWFHYSSEVKNLSQKVRKEPLIIEWFSKCDESVDLFVLLMNISIQGSLVTSKEKWHFSQNLALVNFAFISLFSVWIHQDNRKKCYIFSLYMVFTLVLLLGFIFLYALGTSQA